jgi:hypothetical protein
MLRLLVLVCFTLGLALPAAAECKAFKLEIPDSGTLNLPDGQHIIAAIGTEKGKLEVRVNVKAKVFSPFELLLAGKIMKPTPQAQVDKSILDCLKKQLPPGRSIANSRGSSFDWFVRTAHAAPMRTSLCVILGTNCRDSVGQCCSLVCCDDQCAIRCASY